LSPRQPLPPRPARVSLGSFCGESSDPSLCGLSRNQPSVALGSQLFSPLLSIVCLLTGFLGSLMLDGFQIRDALALDGEHRIQGIHLSGERVPSPLGITGLITGCITVRLNVREPGLSLRKHALQALNMAGQDRL
jgi:hypothetical protein